MTEENVIFFVMAEEKNVHKNENSESNLEDLIRSSAQDDGESFSELCAMYDKMLQKAVATHSVNMDMPKEDLFQEAMLAFYRAAKSYNIGSAVSFGYYARKCVNNALISLRRKEKSAKRKKVKSTADVLHMPTHSVNVSLDECAKVLTEYEFVVFKLYVMGKSYDDIATTVGTNRKSVGNAIYRAKVKVHKSYE